MKKKECKNGLCNKLNQTPDDFIPENKDEKGVAFFLYKNDKTKRGFEKKWEDEISYNETIRTFL